MVDGTYYRQFIRMFGDQRDVLAKMNARRGSFDVLEFAPNFSRRFRLRVKGFIVAHPSPSVDDDAGLGLSLWGVGAGSRFKEGGQRQASQSHTGTKEITPTMLQAQHLC